MKETLKHMAKNARARAEEVFTTSELFKDAKAKQMMSEIALMYIRLAERLEAVVDE